MAQHFQNKKILSKAQKGLQKIRRRVEKGRAKSKTRRGILEDVTFRSLLRHDSSKKS